MSNAHGYEEPPLYVAVVCIIHYGIMYLFGKLRDFLRLFGLDMDRPNKELTSTRHFPPLLPHFESFYTRNVYRRVTDCFQRPVASRPGAEFQVMERISDDYWWTFYYSGRNLNTINFGSYNYLGFADDDKLTFPHVKAAIQNYGIGICSSRHEVGQVEVLRELDNLVAEFVGVEAAITFGMGFATNALNIPALFGKGCCVVSDELNHTSLILGIRLSGAETRVFKHNDINSLEQCLENAVVFGQRRTHRPFRKIIVVVEGIYSMEGSIVKLKDVVALKNKYKAYLYVDEAHSIGAIGRTGRGICEYHGVNPRDVDILMGTFSKSFSAAGGYIAGSRALIDVLRTGSHSCAYACSMPPSVAQQVVSSMRVIMDKEGQGFGPQMIRRLAWNSRYFRRRLIEMGFIVYGDTDSPVIPLMLYSPLTMAALSREALENGLAVVVVGFPATPLLQCRARFCMSAGHTKEMMDRALDTISDIGEKLRVKHSRLPLPEWCRDALPESPHVEKTMPTDLIEEPVLKKRIGLHLASQTGL